MSDSNESQRLSEYSTRTNVNAMQIALVDQRTAIVEKRTEEYHHRLHKAEDELLVVKTVQSIHDVQIQGMRKILVGNGDRETIPMDLERLDRAIAEILKVDQRDLNNRLKTIEDYKEKLDARAWQIAIIIIGLIISNIWQWFVK